MTDLKRIPDLQYKKSGSRISEVLTTSALPFILPLNLIRLPPCLIPIKIIIRLHDVSNEVVRVRTPVKSSQNITHGRIESRFTESIRIIS